jgi:hypothetical protein
MKKEMMTRLVEMMVRLKKKKVTIMKTNEERLKVIGI